MLIRYRYVGIDHAKPGNVLTLLGTMRRAISTIRVSTYRFLQKYRHVFKPFLLVMVILFLFFYILRNGWVWTEQQARYIADRYIIRFCETLNGGCPEFLSEPEVTYVRPEENGGEKSWDFYYISKSDPRDRVEVFITNFGEPLANNQLHRNYDDSKRRHPTRKT